MAKSANGESALSQKLHAAEASGKRTKTTLQTDQRVLARVTDGIYRQPASALRELISNAYDADAENVWIQTDAPRFEQIVISDDGNGLSLATLANLVHHIGGSPKRTPSGVKLGVADSKNPTLSPGGRKLIGKIGIGLFAVAQLTRHFQIITKEKGKKYRHVADIVLKTFSEDQLSELKAGDSETFHTGEVEIWSEPASDKKSHGTQIVLMNLKDYAKSLLQTRDRWERVQLSNDTEPERVLPPPKYHIGSIDPDTGDIRQDDAELPWEPADEPEKRFGKLYQAILDEVGQTTTDPSIEDTFDNYLQMLWTLGLSAPVEYVDKHPFELEESDDTYFFCLSNDPKGQATEMHFASNRKRVCTAARLTDSRSHQTTFNVYVDEVKLFRPIRFTELPTTSQAAMTTPMLFVGQCRPDLGDIPKEITGGSELAFEAYFFLSPKIVPKENNGVLVRIANASGSLFDDSFMHYEVAEHNRLKKITAEVFVSDGLDAALNIDRESFNYSHPHYQFLTRWIHRALRQVMNKHKDLGKKARDNRRKAESKRQLRSVAKSVKIAIEELGEDAPLAPARVEFVDEETAAKDVAKLRKAGDIALSRSVVFKDTNDAIKRSAKGHNLFEEQIAAVAQLLDAYGLLQQLPYSQQEELLHAICEVFRAGGTK